MTIIKKPIRSFKKSNGLTLSEYFGLEKKCLELINKNYKCTCKKKRNHFPSIIRCDTFRYEFELTDQGMSIDKMILKRKKINIRDVDEQIDCILDNLNRNGIRHLDLHDSGKNVCIANDNTISVIDFDVASIGTTYLSKTLHHRAVKYGTDYKSYLVIAKIKIQDMVKKVTI